MTSSSLRLYDFTFYFFLLTQTAETLLPTLKSRLLIVRGDTAKIFDERTIKSFLKKSKKDRLDDLKEIIESKDKEEAICFLRGLEEALHAEGNMIKNSFFNIHGHSNIIWNKFLFNAEAPNIDASFLLN